MIPERVEDRAERIAREQVPVRVYMLFHELSRALAVLSYYWTLESKPGRFYGDNTSSLARWSTKEHLDQAEAILRLGGEI